MTIPCTAGHTWTWGSSPGEFNYRIEPGTPCDCGATVWTLPATFRRDLAVLEAAYGVMVGAGGEKGQEAG